MSSRSSRIISNKLNSNRKRSPFFHNLTKSSMDVSYWPKLSHVPNTESIIAAMRLESTDWPISDYYSPLETSPPRCGEQLHRVWKRDGSSNIY